MKFTSSKIHPPSIAILCILYLCVRNVCAGHLSRPPHNLSCYHCNSLKDGDACRYLQLNNVEAHACNLTQMFCSVVLFQYSTDSNEYLFYSVQRQCEETCQDGCSTVGERVKLFLCRSCCNGYLCNIGNKAHTHHSNTLRLLFVLTSALCWYFALVHLRDD